MLIIYNTLQLGGIETFYVRMAKERHRLGLKTKMLLTQPKYFNNKELLEDVQKYADVYFLEDYSMIPRWIFYFIPHHFLLITPIKIKKIAEIFDGINSVHVSSSIYGFFYYRLAKSLKISLPLTMGVYHSREFSWELSGRLPFYEKNNRKLFFNERDIGNRIVFNEKLAEYLFPLNYSSVACFPLGVIDEVDCSVFQENGEIKNKDKNIIIGSVGRLVRFKSYNLWILEIVKKLNSNGFSVKCIIYGDGPLRQEMENSIKLLNMGKFVSMPGSLPYSKFKEKVKEFDIFIGSGTAIVEAASLGVPSIIGIEQIKEPLTYGFLSEIPGFSYNEDGLYKKISVFDKIKDFINLNEFEKKIIIKEHVEKSEIFLIENCVKNFEKMDLLDLDEKFCRKYNSVIFRINYSLSYFLFSLQLKLKRKNIGELVYG